MTDPFELHPQLAKDTYPVGQTDLCEVLLSRDARYPWLILVPRQADLREMHDLSNADQMRLMTDITHISQAMQTAWPGPIWGVGAAQDYSDAALTDALTRAATCLP